MVVPGVSVTLPRPSDPLEFVETHDVPLPSAPTIGVSTVGSKFISIVHWARMVSA
jgi:hypothetical protein